MRKIFTFLFVLIGFAFFYGQQQQGTFTISPPTFTENTEITITVSNINPSQWGVTDVYLWAWYFDASGNQAGDSPTNGTWQNSNETQKMTANGDGTFSYTLTPSTFYNATNISRIGFLVKAKDGTGDKKTQDNLADVGGFQLVLTNPTSNSTLVESGESVTITAATSGNANFSLTANGALINQATGISSYSYTTVITQNTNFVLSATQGSETREVTFSYVVAPTVIEETMPAGLLDGLNLNPNDATKATLVFYAPGKEFVHIVGDFNNWQTTDEYLMKKDPDANRFWLEISNLTPQFNHLYQYSVEYQIRVADPYSTLLLDGFGNDAFIPESVFPNLPNYPAGQSQAITILRTGDPEFQWSEATLNFEKPAKTDLVIYELLIRDFDERHSFDAVRDRLDYLQGLGVNAIEFMPLNEFDGNESWGYNPSFHMALDKYYGTKDAFKTLIDECHRRGIAVIVDVVYNHASGQHPYYRMWNTDNGGTGGQATAENPFFNPVATHSYSVFNDFNHQQQAVKDYVNRTVTYWIEEFKIDGMRWDLTKGFTQNCTASNESCTNATQPDRIEVLKGYADNQWASDPDFYVIFEHLGGIQEEEQWADYRVDEGKGIMFWNKQTDPYNEATMGYHDGGKSNFSGASYQVKGFKQPSAISYMESHDEERLMFKNLAFGNAEGNYDVTQEAIALARMKTAGAFFFTIPGPKLIWQFGELGYEISINENGRTGNKPILWEYAEEPNRKAIYDSWKDLIKLKLEEPIFKTPDIELDLSSSSGLKTIHLRDANATGDNIGFVTIIGNFGVSTQEINPDFQEVGTWFNPLQNNATLSVTNTNTPISLAPGEFRIYTNNPSLALIDPEDLDADGVPNTLDLCPDTPFGSTVDVEGCAIFTLPTNNFALRTTAESCRNSNNGMIFITAQESLNYKATISGDTEQTQDFTDEISFSNLAAGTYHLCIVVVGQSDYERCYDIVIAQPDELSVSSKIGADGKSLELTLEGGTSYIITVNEKQYLTSMPTFTVPLEYAINRVEVKTNLACQGSIIENYVLSQDMIAYPNPVRNGETLKLLIPQNQKVQNIKVYNLKGQLLHYESFDENLPILELNMNRYPSGLLFIQAETEGGFFDFKVLKQQD